MSKQCLFIWEKAGNPQLIISTVLTRGKPAARTLDSINLAPLAKAAINCWLTLVLV